MVAQAAAMSAGRDEVLARIRRALGDVPTTELPEHVPVARDYRRALPTNEEELAGQFAAMVGEDRAAVRRIRPERIAAEVEAACRRHGLRRLAVPPDLPRGWRPGGVELVEDHGLSAGELDALDGALTGCATAIAQTGTLVLDGRGACGRRALTLVPDHHICVVGAEQIVALVPEAIDRLAAAVRDGRAPITLISGPSATSDIELSRVEGVHGPRNLVVLIAGP